MNRLEMKLGRKPSEEETESMLYEEMSIELDQIYKDLKSWVYFYEIWSTYLSLDVKKKIRNKLDKFIDLLKE